MPRPSRSRRRWREGPPLLGHGGTAGAADWENLQERGARYEYSTELLTAEKNAAGSLRAGATELLVNDSHSKMVMEVKESVSRFAANSECAQI